MEDIIVARQFKSPIGRPEIEGGLASSAWCFDLHRVQYRESYLSLAGTRMICRFGAPDAEAVREALRQSPPRPEYVHSVSQFGPEEPIDSSGSEALVVVERMLSTPFDPARLAEMGEKARWCAELYRVRFLRTYLARDRQRMICLFRGPDAEAVRKVQASIDFAYEQLWSARLITPPATA